MIEKQWYEAVEYIDRKSGVGVAIALYKTPLDHGEVIKDFGIFSDFAQREDALEKARELAWQWNTEPPLLSLYRELQQEQERCHKTRD